MGGGGDTTNVTKTGLGDRQYSSLKGGQNSINQNIDHTKGIVRARANALGKAMESHTQSLRDQINRSDDASDRNFGTLFRQNDRQTNQIIDQVQDVERGVDGLGNNIDNIDRTVSQGFQKADNQFNQIGNQMQGLSGDIQQGFGDTQSQLDSGLGDLQTNMSDQFGQASQERMDGFQGLSNQVGSGFASQADFLDQMSQNVLGGQQAIENLVGDTGNRLDTYYGDLAGRQEDLQEQVGGVQSGLTDFSQSYEENVDLANQTRADIQDAVINQTDQIRTDLGNVSQAQSEQQTRLMDAVGGVRDSVQEGTEANQQQFNLAAQQRERQGGDFSTSLNSVRDLLMQTGDRLDGVTRQQYTDLVTPLGNNMLDVPAMIAEAESFRQQVMGTPETPEAGFAGANPLPYTLTR